MIRQDPEQYSHPKTEAHPPVRAHLLSRTAGRGPLTTASTAYAVTVIEPGYVPLLLRRQQRPFDQWLELTRGVQIQSTPERFLRLGRVSPQLVQETQVIVG